MSNETYDRLKFIAQILLPALGTLYFALAGVWGLPSAEQVVAIVIIADTFLGVFLHLGSKRYQRKFVGTGNLKIRENESKQSYILELDGDPEELKDKDKVVFKVN